MKTTAIKIFTSVVAFWMFSTALAQTDLSSQNGRNYRVNNSILVPGITLRSQFPTLTSAQNSQLVSYLDDNGDPVQKIFVQSSFLDKDVVRIFTKDAFGRQAVQYLPYTSSTNNGFFRSSAITEQSAYYHQTGNSTAIPVDDVPYSTAYFESSPLGRVIEQSGTGKDWQKDLSDPLESHTAVYQYGTNAANEVRRWTVAGTDEGTSLVVDYYPAGSLTYVYTKTMVAQNNNLHDNKYREAKEYTDRLGRIVMKSVKSDTGNPGTWAETHYVYDSYNQLRFILPPNFITQIGSGTTAGSVPAGYTLLTVNTTFQTNKSSKYVYLSNVSVAFQPPAAGGSTVLSNGLHVAPFAGNSIMNITTELAYQFIYDNDGKKVGEKSPGIDWVYYVYDNRDRLALTQDGNQRKNNQWSFIKYDIANRPVLTGVTTIAGTRGTVQAQALSYTSIYKYESRGSVVHGYTNNTYPNVTDANSYLTVNYYDDYSFSSLIGSSDYNYNSAELGTGVMPSTNFTRISGKATAVKSRVVGPSSPTWLWTVIYYDDHQLPIQTISGNHLGGTDIVSTTYNFIGDVVKTKTNHSSSSYGTLSYSSTIENVFEHPTEKTGRVVKVIHQNNDQTPVILSAAKYNESNIIYRTDYYSEDNGTTYRFGKDETRNIKGWLTSLNVHGQDYYLSTDYQYQGYSDLEDTRYDGALTTQSTWEPNPLPYYLRYEFRYDPMGRLINGKFNRLDPDDGRGDEAATYDLNGNILTMNRNSGKVLPVGSDRLVYNYGTYGNKLMSVTDNSTASASVGFNDGNTTGDDYAYDSNGNLVSDKNKAISSITYNVLNKIDRVNFSNGVYLQFTYDATGLKLRQELYNPAGLPEKRDYVGSINYINEQIQFVENAEGRVKSLQNVNMISNGSAATASGFDSGYTSTVTPETVSGETMVKVVSKYTTAGPAWSCACGLVSIGNQEAFVGPYSFFVKAGETYKFRILGYQTVGATSAKLYVTPTLVSNATDTKIGPALPVGASAMAWREMTYKVPAGVTSITVGVIWEGTTVGDTFYINHASLYNLSHEYEYYVPDHLGNIRSIIQMKPGDITYKATMESENFVTENQVFQNIDPTKIGPSIQLSPDPNNEAIALNSTYRIGPAKSIKVYKGDIVFLNTKAYYINSGTGLTPAGASAMASAMLGALIPGAGTSVVDGVGSAYTNSTSHTNPAFTLGYYTDNSYPAAFLNYILFDENYVPIAGKSVRIQSGANTVRLIQLNTSLINQNGYLYTYLSYDNQNPGVDVYFDDFTVEHVEGELIQVNHFYPYGSLLSSWTRDGETENREFFQGKSLEPYTQWSDFGSRMYDAQLGRWFADDPQHQFASGYLAMGNNPVIGTDPNGEFVNFIIGAIVGGIGGYQTGKALGMKGWGLLAYTLGGAAIGTMTSGLGTAIAGGAATTLGTVGAQLLGGAVAGAFNGLEMAALGGGDIGKGALYGGVGGLAGASAGLINVPGIVPGALYGAATGGVISGGINVLAGGDFNEGFKSGAISGGIMGGISGGQLAMNSKYERNIVFGGATDRGKMDYIDDLLLDMDAYNHGLIQWDVNNGLNESTNARTIPTLNGSEIPLDFAYRLPSGVKSNLEMKIQGRSLRAIRSTLGHELTHVFDLASGYSSRYFYENNQNIGKTILHLEIRAYRSNVDDGYNRGTYLKILNNAVNSFNIRYNK